MIKLYIDHLSQPSRAVYTVFLLAKISVEVVETRAGRDTRKPEYLKIFDTGTVPAVLDGDVALCESHAIMEYLCDRYMPNSNLMPRDLVIRAKINQYLHWHHMSVRRGIHGYLEEFRLIPKATGNPPNMEVVRFLEHIKNDTLKFIDKKLEKYPYIAGTDHLTIADISCFCEIVQMRFVGENLSPYPNILRWKKTI